MIEYNVWVLVLFRQFLTFSLGLAHRGFASEPLIINSIMNLTSCRKRHVFNQMYSFLTYPLIAIYDILLVHLSPQARILRMRKTLRLRTALHVYALFQSLHEI